MKRSLKKKGEFQFFEILMYEGVNEINLEISLESPMLLIRVHPQDAS